MPEPPVSVPAQLARINEISLVARTTWFGLLAYLAFVGITLLGVEDADFFVPTRQTQLPLVNVSIPTSSFFWFAPMLGAALYAYLHLQLVKLWEALAAPPPKINGKHLSELIYPWLISDYGLSIRDDGALRPRTMAWMSQVATWVLGYASGPLVLFGFWLRSILAHDPWMTGLIAICLLVSLYIAFTSFWTLRERTHGSPARINVWVPARRQYLCIATLYAVGAGIWFGALGIDGLPSSLSRLSPWPANLRGVELVAKPADWRDYRTARRRFRAIWCKRQGLKPEICGSLYFASNPEPPQVKRVRKEWCETEPREIKHCPKYFAKLDEEFSTEWKEEWASKIDALETLDLRGKDFRNADMAIAFIAGADFRRAPMEGANLWRARMEGANLRGSQMEGADLSGAQMEGANLVGAQMKGAILSEARMEGASLRGAQMEGADLWQARMEGADLSWAQMEEANLVGAQMKGANLIFAQMKGADLSGAQMEEANLSEAQMEGAYLVRAQMKGAYLVRARMEGANLRGAQMEGAKFHSAELKSAALTETFADTSVRAADLSSDDVTQDILNSVFGDAATIIPDGLVTPDHWDDETLENPWDDDPKFEAWLRTRQAAKKQEATTNGN